MRVPFLNFEVGPVDLLLNFDWGPLSQVPGSRDPGPTFIPFLNLTKQ